MKTLRPYVEIPENECAHESHKSPTLSRHGPFVFIRNLQTQEVQVWEREQQRLMQVHANRRTCTHMQFVMSRIICVKKKKTRKKFPATTMSLIRNNRASGVHTMVASSSAWLRSDARPAGQLKTGSGKQCATCKEGRRTGKAGYILLFV